MVPPPAVLHAERVEVVVAAPEDRRPQRAHERELVGGVVDCLQHEQEVADLAACRRRATTSRRGTGSRRRRARPRAGRATCGRGAGSRCRPARHGSHSTVPSAPRRVTVHPSRSAACDRGGDVGRLVVAQLGGRDLPRLVRFAVDGDVGMRFGAEQRDRRAREPGLVVALGVERDVLRLRVGLGDDEIAEHVVHEVDHRARRPEVAGELVQRRAERTTGAEERSDVGAPEAVDRLLGVADDEEPPGIGGDLVPRSVARVGIAGREQRGEVALDRVGVLELVEEQARVALAEAAADVDAVLGVAEQRAATARGGRGTRARPSRRRAAASPIVNWRPPR